MKIVPSSHDGFYKGIERFQKFYAWLRKTPWALSLFVVYYLGLVLLLLLKMINPYLLLALVILPPFLSLLLLVEPRVKVIHFKNRG